MNVELTPDIVVNYWAYMCRVYKIEILSKKDSCLMKFVRPFTRIPKGKWQEFSTTIGHKMYTNEVPGVGDEVDLLRQVGLITHESGHRVQDDMDTLYGPRYLLDREYRMVKEVNAYTCNMEVYHELTGGMIPITYILEVLESYRLRRKDLVEAERMLEIRADAIQRFWTLASGWCITPAGKTFKAWFQSQQMARRGPVQLRPITDPYDFRRLLV